MCTEDSSGELATINSISKPLQPQSLGLCSIMMNDYLPLAAITLILLYLGHAV